ncbi:MAG: M23 family metallopeptidase [Treponema sp.]|nr:M23 family metallopeptidase [Treponema sp.]
MQNKNCKIAVYQSESYTMNVFYNETLVPGDAIFVRLSVSTPKNHKKNKIELERYAALRLYQNSKIIEKADFYNLGKRKNSNTIDLLCGVPLSSWLKNDEYSLKVFYNFTEDGNTTKEFTLPLVFTERTFDSEIIDLDEKNTDIKTDNSPERMAQIEKLNNILFTSFPTDIYNLNAFSTPTKSTRYTAHFGDRRTYKYVNGKTTTNLHYGNDYGVPEGTEVLSCGEGKVVMAESRISTGWSVVVEHLPGLYSLYYHLSELNVKEGDFVHSGDLLGKSGSTGLATGPHLHWEIRLNGEAVRPEFFLNNFTFEPENLDL